MISRSDIYELIRYIGAGDVPAPPFKINRGSETVLDAETWLNSLKRDAELGDRSPRAKYGRLQQDIREAIEKCNSENIRNRRETLF